MEIEPTDVSQTKSSAAQQPPLAFSFFTQQLQQNMPSQPGYMPVTSFGAQAFQPHHQPLTFGHPPSHQAQTSFLQTQPQQQFLFGNPFSAKPRVDPPAPEDEQCDSEYEPEDSKSSSASDSFDGLVEEEESNAPINLADYQAKRHLL